jgi:glucose-6-phosphate 1-dehydrogenase
VGSNRTSGMLMEAKSRALGQVLTPEPGADFRTAIRGQYVGGWVSGQWVPGYREESGVTPQSSTETYAKIRLFLDDQRWKGVPFYLEAGKRLARKETRVEIEFKDDRGIRGLGPRPALPKKLVFRIHPESDVIAEYPSGRTQILDWGRKDLRGIAPVEEDPGLQDGYSLLLREAIAGNGSLFLSEREVMDSWRCVEPIIRHWNENHAAVPMHAYGPGGGGRLTAI